MDYINELRAVVGTRPLIMVGATLLALNHDNQLLMMKRTDNHCWGVPGGAMELGESLEETVRRETEEEIGVTVKDLELFGVYSGQELYYKYRDGNEVYNVSVVYITRNFSGAIRVNQNEHSEHRFFDLDRLPEEISPPIKSILRDLVNQDEMKV